MLTDFGFKNVKQDEKHKFVKDLFSSVSSKYDLMNDVMSGTIHRYWKRYFVQNLPLKANDRLLDLAGGTGDITFKIFEKFNYFSPQISICDLTFDMMREGQKKAIDKGILNPIHWVCGRAESIPFEDHTFDGVFTSFGFRNMSDKEAALKEIYRILKPGGWFYCLEFSTPTCSALEKAYKVYSFHIIPKIGKYVANDEEAYQYLVESIQKFPDQETFQNLIQENGFENTGFENLTNGIVAIHSGYKPTENN